MLKITDTEWGRRIQAAIEAGEFTDDDIEESSKSHQDVDFNKELGCPITELWTTRTAEVINEDYHIGFMYHDMMMQIRCHSVEEVQSNYQDILDRINNDDIRVPITLEVEETEDDDS